MRHFFLACAVFLLSLGPVSGQEAEFQLLGDGILLYDNEQIAEDEDAEIDDADIDVLRDLLRKTPGLTTLRLNSSGGEVWAARQMADIVIDFELKTQVADRCTSSCTLIFLGGVEREMARGAKLGFHHWSWSPGAIARYYERRREAEDWDSLFEFSSWLYEDTQREVHQLLDYYVERGVAPGFAIRSLREGSDGMWYPRRKELLEAGVLTQ